MNSSGRNEKKGRKPVTDLPSAPRYSQPSKPTAPPHSERGKAPSKDIPPLNGEQLIRMDGAVSEPKPPLFDLRIPAAVQPPPQILSKPKPNSVSVSQPHQSQRQQPQPQQSKSPIRHPQGAHPSPSFDRVRNQRNLSELLFQPAGVWGNRNQLQLQIGKQILHRSKSMDSANFLRISKLDLESMAELYDQLFFQGLCLPLARSYGLTFRLSSRMTRAGGKTTRTIFRGTRAKQGKTHYEIALSTSLLFQSFRNPEDTIRVCGYDCQDRLTAMQRVVEHEMIHLCEMLAWIHSDCAAGRFQSIARNMFGHTEHKHELITQQERAAKEFNIRAGSVVAFEFEGKKLTGVVNRITRRATILVEDLRGARYTNGRHYLKYYVPIHQLRPIN